MRFFIKNMVCDRCKIAVKVEFEKLGLHPLYVGLGEVEIAADEIKDNQLRDLTGALALLGFELLTDKRKQLVNQIKSLIVECVHYSTEPLTINLSAYLGEKLGINYSSLSHIFSEMESDTIERFFIRQKIEKAKELLTYGEKSLSEIAYQLNYSSVAHLSSQFKKFTNETASSYKKKTVAARTTLDQV